MEEESTPDGRRKESGRTVGPGKEATGNSGTVLTELRCSWEALKGSLTRRLLGKEGLSSWSSEHT